MGNHGAAGVSQNVGVLVVLVDFAWKEIHVWLQHLAACHFGTSGLGNRCCVSMIIRK